MRRPRLELALALAAAAATRRAAGDGRRSAFLPEHENLLCNQEYGESHLGDTYPLPCRAPREDWRSPFRHQFLITAWWPPGIQYVNGSAAAVVCKEIPQPGGKVSKECWSEPVGTTQHPSELKAYKAANFNLLLGGNVNCRGSNPNPSGPLGSPREAFDCVARAITDAAAEGLYFTIDPTSITNNMANPANCSKHGTCNYRGSDLYVVGGREGFGGVSESGPGGYPTSTEVAWMVSELERRNLSSHVAQMFLHDDEIGDSAAVKDALSWLRKHAPHITGSTNTFSDSGPESLYASRNGIFSPEQYAITDPYQEWKSGQVGRHGYTARDMVNQQLIMFANDRLLTERYRLDHAPLFALGDGGDVATIRSDSLVRVQVYSAVASGARGLYYYCWGHGIWNSTAASENFNPSSIHSNYEVVRRTNADAQVWGTLLLGSRHVGVIRRPATNTSLPHRGPLVDHSVAPGPGQPVVAMEDELMVGVFSDGLRNETGFLMLVDLRTSTQRNDLPPRTTNVTLAAACTASAVPGGAGGWAEQLWRDNEQRSPLGSAGSISVTIAAGGAALYRVSGAGCGRLLRGARDWWYNPRLINLRHSYPETSVKASSYAGSQWMPQPAERDVTGQGFGRGWCNQQPCTPGRQFKMPGGLAGASSSFIIGGSRWENGAGFESDEDAQAWAEAGFLMASLPAENETAMVTGLGRAAAWGLFVLASKQNSSAALRDTDINALTEHYSCSTVFAGFVMAADGSSQAAARHMRSVAYWQLPLALGVHSADAAAAIAADGVPFVAIWLPKAASQALTTDEMAAADWANAVVTRLAPLVSDSVGLNQSVPMTPAVAIPLCQLHSDSLLRFGAFIAPVLGAQAVWWEGMGTCGTRGTRNYDLVADINNRLSQWAEPLFLRRSQVEPQGHWLSSTVLPDGVSPMDAGTFKIDQVWSTSSIKLPPLPGVNGTLVHARKPGFSAASLVQGMDDDLLVIELRNMTTNTQTPYCCGNPAKNMTGDMECTGGSKGGPGPEQQCATMNHNVLLVISTRLSMRNGGAPLRQLNLTLRSDVWTTHPIVAAPFHGFSSSCNLNWLGAAAPLRLAGGSAAILSYTVKPPYAPVIKPVEQRQEELRASKIGRRPPSRADPML